MADGWADEPDWYKDAILYELRVPSFYDSNDDGIGDLRGLTQKLDYLKDLGVTALWLLPFYPSPLRDDGYDIADYTAVHPDYGSIADFRALLREAHRRELRVVTELVLNHTSDQHPWFQRARRAPPGSPERDFYVWSETPDRYADARIIFKDFEHSNWSYDPLAHAYYWHRFYAHQPDLNFENPAVRRALVAALEFWLDMGVDGVRLDAVPYLYEREGSSCENLPETHAFLRELRAHIDRKYRGRMLLAEANQWPEDAVPYFGQGDECHMAFHFPIMPRLFMAIHMEDRYPILDILAQTPHIPDPCQWALFLRNHDELTLEMVTDEERDYMWRVYAREPKARINLGIRRRLAPLLDNNRRRIELMNGLLFSLPGTPVLYYGDELGMGDNVFLGDRSGVRTPMQWSPDRNAGFSRTNPQRLFLPPISDPEYHYEARNVEVQQANPSSLLWWMKRLIALRKQHRAFGRGTLEPLATPNRRVLAFLRRSEGETLLVVANLARFAQCAELELAPYRGWSLTELFGRSAFPQIGAEPYRFMLGPHGFFWFELQPPQPPRAAADPLQLPRLRAAGAWTALLEPGAAAPLERALARRIPGESWFAGQGRALVGLSITGWLPLGPPAAHAGAAPGARPAQPLALLLVRASYAVGEPELYSWPLRFTPGAEPGPRTLALLGVEPDPGPVADPAPEPLAGTLEDASAEPELGALLLAALLGRRKLRGHGVQLCPVARAGLREQLGEGGPHAPGVLGTGVAPAAWAFGERLVGKLARRLDEGESPALELAAFLGERAGFAQTPPLVGHLELRRPDAPSCALALFHGYLPNEGDAWNFTLEEIERSFEGLLASAARSEASALQPASLCQRSESEPPAAVRAWIGSYLESARRIGEHTGELHRALASARSDPAFAPEPLVPFGQRSVYQSLRNLALRALGALRERLPELPPALQPLAEELLAAEAGLVERLRSALGARSPGQRIRVHGDYRLGRLLYTGRDFVAFEFAGEAGRSLHERRRKRTPLVDVAGMVMSFHYAMEHVLSGGSPHGRLRSEDLGPLEACGRSWCAWVSAVFVRQYLDTVRPIGILPGESELAAMLDAHLLEKALSELARGLEQRPDRVGIALRGMRDILRGGLEGL